MQELSKEKIAILQPKTQFEEFDRRMKEEIDYIQDDLGIEEVPDWPFPSDPVGITISFGVIGLVIWFILRHTAIGFLTKLGDILCDLIFGSQKNP